MRRSTYRSWEPIGSRRRVPAANGALSAKAGWETDSPNPAGVVVTTLKKLAVQRKVKKLDGRNEFKALR
jgi:hypothetical protein